MLNLYLLNYIYYKLREAEEYGNKLADSFLENYYNHWNLKQWFINNNLEYPQY